MIERIRYGGVSNPYNYSEFTCDTAADIADLPTNKDIGKYKNLDTCSIGSKATVISDRTMYILNGDNQWVLLKDYKATGGGSSILIDETLTESGQAADAKAVGDKIAEVKESAHTHLNKDVLDGITSNKITAWDGYSAEIQTVKDGLVGKKDSNSEDSTGEIFNSYEGISKNIVSGFYSHAEGCYTKALGNRSHAEGSVTKASGNASHAEGSSTKAIGENSHSEGYYAEASGKYSHAEGSYTKAFEDSSHSEGYYAEASGKYSHAEGARTKAIGESSHAEGNQTKASGEYSHAEGSVTKASDNASHAEGAYTEASSWQSHAEGFGTKATAPYSHAEGDRTEASGFASHAEGECTIAYGSKSHAEGSYTKASGNYQHVQGKYNKEDSNSKYAFIIGNGTDENNRSNAIAIDWNGKIYVNNATEGVDVSALAITIAELQSQLSRKTIQFRHGKGTFTATVTGTNVVWQYGGQKAQGSNCTFDVKSDNGLICMDFDSITSLSIQNDAENKMDLSDLGGKITNTLSLSSCQNITGDLSDLGGKITNTLSLSSCQNITGDLSDLGGKITNTLSLSSCQNITGVYSGTKYPKTFAASKTAITSADMDANLINFAASGVKSGTFTATGMKRTAASDDAVATLVANGWTVSGLTKEG